MAKLLGFLVYYGTLKTTSLVGISYFSFEHELCQVHFKLAATQASYTYNRNYANFFIDKGLTRFNHVFIDSDFLSTIIRRPKNSRDK